MALKDIFPLSPLGDPAACHFDDTIREARLAAANHVVSPRFDLAVIAVSGEDAATFLHGQFTTHVKRLRPGDGGLCAWCTPQGRVSFLFHLLAEPTRFLLLVPTGESARIVQRLRMFVLRANVTIEVLTDSLGVLGVSLHEEAHAALPKSVSALPALAHYKSTSLGDGLNALNIVPACLYLIWGESVQILDWWRTCGLPTVGTGAWQLLEIEQGLPRIVGSVANEFLPQQLNLDALDAVAFDKGCYPGQEIVARLKYRGAVKARAMVAAADSSIAVGDKIYVRGERARNVGSVIEVAASADGARLLVVLELDVRDSALETATGTSISVRPTQCFDRM